MKTFKDMQGMLDRVNRNLKNKPLSYQIHNENGTNNLMRYENDICIDYQYSGTKSEIYYILNSIAITLENIN